MQNSVASCVLGDMAACLFDNQKTMYCLSFCFEQLSNNAHKGTGRTSNISKSKTAQSPVRPFRAIALVDYSLKDDDTALHFVAKHEYEWALHLVRHTYIHTTLWKHGKEATTTIYYSFLLHASSGNHLPPVRCTKRRHDLPLSCLRLSPIQNDNTRIILRQ